jgi:hypothetical protein
MTLILAAVNQRQAVIVSDRRLSFDGVVHEEESNKAGTIDFRDAQFAFAFTGLAGYGTFRTRPWLLTALMEASKPDGLAGHTWPRLAKLASEQFSKFPERFRALSIVFAGYRYDEDPPRAAVVLVSNSENIDGSVSTTPAESFETSWVREKRPTDEPLALVMALGRERAVEPGEITMLATLLIADKPARAIVGKAVDVIRTAADRAVARQYIGKQCTSIVLPRSVAEAVESEYHSEVKASAVHGVSYVQARGGASGIYAVDLPSFEIRREDSPASVTGPKIGRNAPCWCGSVHPDGRRKKYKHCHVR